MNINLLNQLIADRYIVVQNHPTADLFIYNYSEKAQYDNVWNEWTMRCRGLMMDGNMNIVARPFVKFFNLEQHVDTILPDTNFEVYEKMDGSLGILYWLNDEPFIATRGSFTSEQSMKATEMLKTTYKNAIPKLDKNKTYLFEIIYPENRIVVDYGMEEKLVLLAVIDIATGKDVALEDIGFPLVKRYDGIRDVHALKALEVTNKEGFVVKFENDFRIKLKFEEYKRLHRIMTKVSTKTIWEHLKEGKAFDEMLEVVPDEFYDWVKATKAEFLRAYAEIEAVARQEYKVLEDRKTTAAYFKTCTYPHVMFKMLDGRSYDATVWQLLRPEYEKPFGAKQPSERFSVEG